MLLLFKLKCSSEPLNTATMIQANTVANIYKDLETDYSDMYFHMNIENAMTEKNSYDSSSTVYSTCTIDSGSVTNNIENLHKQREANYPFNAMLLKFGSFHQNDARFGQDTRGNQCTCNDLAYLTMTCNRDDYTVLDLDKVLLIGN